MTTITNININNIDFSNVISAIVDKNLYDENIAKLFTNLVKYDIIEKLEITYNCNLKSIPILSKLTNLNCKRCIELAYIPTLQSLKYLDCSDCYRLSLISIQPNLLYLNCSGCYYLKSIPILSMLDKLCCDHCISLEELPILNSLTVLEYSDIDYYCLNKYSIPLKFINITNEILDNIDKYLEYNSLNINYLSKKLDNGDIDDSLIERVSYILTSYILVKPAHRY